MNKSLAAGIRKPSVAAYERLCGPRAKDMVYPNVGKTADSVQPVWAEVDEDVSREYLQRKNSMGDRISDSFEAQIRQFRPAEKSTR